MDIDRSAPVTARQETLINAVPERVWSVLTDFERWPEWNPDVRSARADGPLQPGTRFHWKAGPSGITSRLEDVQPPTRITWTGSTLGIRAIHVHTLTPRDGATLVTSEESWSGLLPRLLRGRMTTTLTASLESGLAALKAEAEREP